MYRRIPTQQLLPYSVSEGEMQKDAPEIPAIEFAPARGARLAWQRWGNGTEEIVAIPPLAQNIEVAWEAPLIRAMLERFGTFSRYLHFDKRGTGASDRRSRVAGIDERVDDIRAVLDHAEIEAAHFFVQSDGGPMALMFAATYPDRVKSLTMFGSGAHLAPPWSEEERIERRERMVKEWGTPQSRIVDAFAPSLAANQVFRTWHQRYERLAATTDSLRELIDISAEMDAREVLPTLDVPTLVLHRVGDRAIPLSLGRDLAESINGARLVELEGDDHYAYAGDVASWMREFEQFVTGRLSPQPGSRRSNARPRIQTLGGFSVELDGRDIPTSDWGSRLARQLTKRLVAARGWPVTRDELIEMLWPGESDMRRLGARLSVLLSTVRRVLRGGVVADRETVRLDLDQVSTDIEDLYAARDDRAVLAAYVGEFLPEDRYEDWTRGIRDEIRSRFVGAAKAVAEEEIAAKNPSGAATLYRKIIAVDPYDDATHRALINALLASGDPGGARRAHAAWTKSMSEIDASVPSFETLS